MRIWRIWLLFFAAFVAGVLAGATAMRVFDHPRVRQAMMHGFDRQQDFLLSRLARELDLTPEQRTRMQETMRETREQLMRLRQRIQPEAQKIMMEGRRRMEEGLTPEQVVRFREFMNRQSPHGRNQPPGQEAPRPPQPDQGGSTPPPSRATPANQPT